MNGRFCGGCRALSGLFLAALAVFLLSAPGCGLTGTLTPSSSSASAASTPAAASQAAGREVLIRADGFFPPELTIKRGEAVRWVNGDDKSHTVTSWREYQESDGAQYADIGAAWNSGDLPPGQSFARVFNEAGRFEYLSFPVSLYYLFQRQPVGVIIVAE